MVRVTTGRTLCSCLIAVLATCTLVAGTADNTGGVAQHWDEWRSLVYKTRAAFFIKGRVEMFFSEETRARSFHTDTWAKFMGATLARERTRAVIDPETGDTREYFNLTPKRGRHYIFTGDSYTVEKLTPTNGFDAPLDQWEIVSSSVFPNPLPDDLGSNKVYVSYNMLSHLRDEKLNRIGDTTTIYVATSKGPERYHVTVGERRLASRPVVDLDTGKKSNNRIMELRLDVTPVDKQKAKDFLGLKGQIEIWVEADTKTLLRISGKIPRVPGRVVVELIGLGKQVSTRAHPG
jgi:hypothetical protein